MNANPFLNRQSEGSERIVPPSAKEEREQFWIARGNRVLWGEEPTTKGEYLEPRRDMHWRCVNGHYFIEQRS